MQGFDEDLAEAGRAKAAGTPVKQTVEAAALMPYLQISPIKVSTLPCCSTTLRMMFDYMAATLRRLQCYVRLFRTLCKKADDSREVTQHGDELHPGILLHIISAYGGISMQNSRRGSRDKRFSLSLTLERTCHVRATSYA